MGKYVPENTLYLDTFYRVVDTDIWYTNYEINSANACDSFDNNFNNKFSRAEVIEKNRVVINENLDTKDEHLSINEHFSENIGYQSLLCQTSI